MTVQTNIAVIGAGGHAKVCIDVLRDNGWQVQACLVDAGGSASPEACNGVPVYKTDDVGAWLMQQGGLAVFVAIGDNQVRRKISQTLSAKGHTLPNAISPHAVIAPSVRMGAGVLVMPGAVINAETHLGDGVIVNTSASVDHDCKIGAYAHIAPACALAGGVSIGSGALCGIGSRYIPGVSVGEGALVAAGAVVIGDHGPGARVAGVPARPLV